MENKLIYICSPYRGNVFKRYRNIRYAKKLTKEALKRGYAPITTHLYLTKVCNDNKVKERLQGMRAGKEILASCGQVLLGTRYGISEGMTSELEKAELLNIPVIKSETNASVTAAEMKKRDDEATAMKLAADRKQKQKQLRKIHTRHFKLHLKTTMRYFKAIFTGEL